MRENVKVREILKYTIIDSKTGKVIEKKEIEITPKKGLRSFFKRIFGKENHATIKAFGFEQMARLLGNVGTQYPINEIGTDTGGWKASTNSVAVGGASGSTLFVNNSNAHWTTAGHYSWIQTRNSGASTSYHNSISISLDIASGQEWWAEIEFRFS